MIRRTVGRDRQGFTLVEVIVASMVLLIALLVIATMFPMGHQQVVDAGRMTLAVTAARQVLEDLGSLPFDNARTLHNFDTANAATLPAANPERAVARRLRYMVAGSGSGFAFTSAELAEYGSVTPIGGAATISIPATATCGAAGSRCEATVTVSVPGLTTNVQLSTVFVRLF